MIICMRKIINNILVIWFTWEFVKWVCENTYYKGLLE